MDIDDLQRRAHHRKYGANHILQLARESVNDVARKICLVDVRDGTVCVSAVDGRVHRESQHTRQRETTTTFRSHNATGKLRLDAHTNLETSLSHMGKMNILDSRRSRTRFRVTAPSTNARTAQRQD